MTNPIKFSLFLLVAGLATVVSCDKNPIPAPIPDPEPTVFAELEISAASHGYRAVAFPTRCVAVK